MAKKKIKNYNEILYELQKQAVTNKTGATNEQLTKQAKEKTAQTLSNPYNLPVVTSKKTTTKTSSKKTSSNKTTTTTKKNDNRTWFSSGAFDDGYDFGDITKSILGTTTDIYQDAVQGALGIGEKTIDAGAYLVGGTAKLFGVDDFANDTKDFIKKDLIDEEKIANRITNTGSVVGWTNNVINGKWSNFNPLNTDDTTIEQNSFLGDKADSLVQSGGQLLATAGLQVAGVPWWLTSGVTSFGAETEQAFNEGATYGEAGISGLITGGAEILTEKLSGGIKFGGQTLDDVLVKPLTEKISNKVVKSVVNLGIDTVGEGTEEVLSDVFSNVGKKLSYEDEKTWNDILTSEQAMDSYLDSFIGGAVLGGVGSVTQQFQSTQSDTESDIQQEQELTEADQRRPNQVETPTNDVTENIEITSEDSLSDIIETDFQKQETDIKQETNLTQKQNSTETLHNVENNAEVNEETIIDDDILPETEAEKQIGKEWTSKTKEQDKVNRPLAIEQAKATGNKTMVGYSPILSNHKLYHRGTLTWVTPEGKVTSKVVDEAKIDDFLSKNKIDRLNNENAINPFENGLDNDIAPIENDLEIQIENALSDKSSKSKRYLGKVTNYVANKIKNVLGVNVENRTHILTDNDIRHMLNQHGNQEIESQKGQIAITKEDIKNIPDIITNPNDIVKGTDNKLGQTIRYIKRYNDNSTYVVEVVPDNSNALIIKTMWKKPSTLTNSIAPSSTSETQGSDISSTFADNISQNTENVNDIAPIKQELNDLTNVLDKTIKDAQKEIKSLQKEINNVKTSVSELAEETKPTIDADIRYSLSEDGEGKTLYTGSSNTNIQQFKVGGVEGTKQSGDRYGKGVYLTTNKDTAKGYAGDSGKVYEISADDLNIFDLNDNITNEMKESLINELNIVDKQYRNSILRNIKTEKTFTDFESAEKFLDTQEAIWEEQDGYYEANKPIIKDVNYDTNEAIIEYTDFNDLENAISNLTGNQLYDALKSISTDDFSSFITGNGYDGISFSEDTDNQQYVIYKNEDKLNILNKDNSNYSLSEEGQDIAPTGDYNVYGDEVKLQVEEVIDEATQPTNENGIKNDSKTLKNSSKNELGYIPKNPTKESSYDEPAKTKSTKPRVTKQKGSTRNTLNYLIFNRNEAIDRYSKATGNKNIKFLADHVNNVQGEISTNINKAQIDNNGKVIGKSIVDIFNQARDAKLTAAFEDYLFHLSNKARHKQGKGSLVPLTESKALIIEYEKAYPEMKKWAKEVNKYNKNNLMKQVEAGLYSAELAKQISKMYEFYVPFFEDVERMYVPSDTKGIKTRGTVRLAKGGANRNLLNFEEAMIRQTQSAITNIRKNQLYQEIVNSSKQVLLGTDADINGLYADENGYYLTAKIDGKNISADIGEDLYRGLENNTEQLIRDIEQRMSFITKPLQTISNWRRNILTTWSPTFIVTNPAKDIQDAPLNSKYAKDWGFNYPKALKELATGKGEHIQEFLNMYGQADLMGDYAIDSGISDITKTVKTKKKLAGITRVNEMLELAPRYAEYLASLKNGTSQMEALYNAREVTTNFGRGGVITKALNRNGFTFLNASVQGFNKLYRNFSGENGAKGVVNASLKAVMLGVVPALYNALSYDDDEDYEALPDYIKDNYYLYKTDDGEFIRIPKGRMMSIFGSAARRALEATQGEEDAFEGYLTNAYSQVGIQNPMESNIFAPLLQAYGSKNGKTWYGTDLVPTRLQDVPVEEQYDESTDKFSIWLGQTFGISPYKVNYVFDQYSGGIGDLLLPTITEEANSDGSFLAPLKDKFVVNSTMDNKYAGEFYSKSDELEVNANSMYATEEDKLMSMYMDEVSWDMSSLYKEKREIQNDTSLTKKEKYERVKEIQDLINETAKNALETYDTGTYTENYVSIGDYEFYKGTDYNGNEEWKTVYDYKVEELAGLGMTPEEKNEYFGLKQDFDALNNEYYDTKDNLESTYGKHSDEFEDESDELYMEKKNKIIDSIMASGLTDDAKAYLYKEYYSSSAIDTITMSGIAVDYILDYQKNNFKADYNSDGKAIPNSRKNKVIDYVNEYDLDIAEKAIIIKSTNTFKFNDYNDEIVSYVADLDISEEDKIYILEELDMTVDEDGYAHWE